MQKPTSKFDFSLARAVLQLEVLKTFLVVGTVYKTSPLPRQVQLLQVENVPHLSSNEKKVYHGHSGIIGLGNIFLINYRQKKIDTG